MARTARAISSTGIYAVVLRAVTDIFEDSAMQEAFMQAAAKYLGDGLLAIKITDNRVEMLIEESENGISMDMKPLVTSFARTYNREYEHEGKVFIDRFKSTPVEDDDTKNECMEYLNGGEGVWLYSGGNTENKEKAPAKKKAKAAKPAAKKKSAPKTGKKQVEVKTPEPEKTEEKPPVRRRNDLPSWLL